MSFIREKDNVKIRIVHKCHGCGNKLPKGEIVKTLTCADGDTISTVHICNDCKTFIRTHCHNCNDCGSCIAEDFYEGLISECRHEKERTD